MFPRKVCYCENTILWWQILFTLLSLTLWIPLFKPSNIPLHNFEGWNSLKSTIYMELSWHLQGAKWQPENWTQCYNYRVILPVSKLWPPYKYLLIYSIRAFTWFYVIITKWIFIPCMPCSGKVEISSGIQTVYFNCKYFYAEVTRMPLKVSRGQTPARADNV